ncbi:hypothetical protein NX059_000006 [Plenodomus lindquistii]|nr:hypothetical protein NX059_000006 [Plenodomus lindquistii]
MLSSGIAILWLWSLHSIPNTVLATVTDIPGIYGPIYPVIGGDYIDPSPHLKSRPSDFVHPGIWHTHEDLERMRTNINAGQEPWKSAFAAFRNDSYSQSSYTMQGPHAVLSRGPVSNFTTFTSDARAAWQNALMWYITKLDAHWKRSTTILDAWGSNLTAIIGTDRSLIIGLDGDLFVNAAEIMRWEGGWVEAGAKWQGSPGFANQIYWLFSRQSSVVGQANYGMASIKAMMSFAVYLDDVVLYNYAVNEYLNNKCAGAPWTWKPETGQSTESGRDQSHVMSGIAWSSYAARVAQSQGSDLYGVGDNTILKGAEYTAKFNLNGTVSYDPRWYRCEAILVNGPWANISTANFGIDNKGKPMWDIVYYQFVVKRGLDAPWTSKAKKAQGTEGPTKSNDVSSWGDLVWAY